MTTPAPDESPVAPLNEPSPLLRHLAGDLAPRIAGLWPDPHWDYLTAPAARRHLVCLAFAHDLEPPADLLTGRLREAAKAMLGRPPPGLGRALARIGEVAWTAEDYRTLLQVLDRPRAAKLLHHAERIDAVAVRRLDSLPARMGEAGLLVDKLNPDAVLVLREAFDALRHRVGAAAAEAATAEWAKARNLRDLFDKVRFDLLPEPAPPPHPGTARLRPLRTKAEIWEVAERFRNCLKTRARYAATGWSAYYEWEGPPGALVEISRDHVYGWFLDEARAAGNEAVPEAARGDIISELGLMGVHVGRSSRDLEELLTLRIGRGRAYWPAAQAVTTAFGAD
jgi:hypothetical protein